MNIAIYKTHYRETLQLGIPIMLGQIGIILVGIVDTYMVSAHSSLELSAASFVNQMFSLAFIFGVGFSYGLTPVISGLFANSKVQTAGETLKNSLLLNLGIGIILTLLMTLLLLHIGLLDQPEDIMPYLIPYYCIQLSSIIVVMLFNSFKQFSDGSMDTLTPMWIMLAGNMVNIIGNYILIFGHFGAPEMGLTGAGLATLSSRIFTLLAFVLLFSYRKKYGIYREGFKKGKINYAILKNLFRLGIPLGCLMGVETASFNLSVIFMGWIGSDALAAHQIVGVITTLGFMIYYGIAAAVTIRVSQYKEKNDYKNIQLASFSGLHIIFGVAALVMIMVFIFRYDIGGWFRANDSVASLVTVLCWSVILYQIGDGLQILFANALRGISDVKYMAYLALFCHFGLALPIGYFCGFILEWGAFGVWCGFPISLTVLGVFLWRRFNKLTSSKI